MMELKEWVDQITTAYRDQDWDQLSDLTFSVKNEFASKCAYEEMENFYDEALKQFADPTIYERVRVKDINPFESKLRESIETGLAIAKNDPSIKGIYFEYFFDGHEDVAFGNIYLCKDYSADSDDWAAEFYNDGIIDGPNVFKYLNYDPDIEFEPTLEVLAKEYVEAHFLGACIRVIKGIDGFNYPFGFAEHDHDIIRVPTNY